MKETKKQKSDRLRKTVIIGHRKRKNLCIFCGKDPHEGKECDKVIYNKADNRFENHINKPKINFKKKIKTIKSYRKKKILCIRCGQEIHNGYCKEHYHQVDNRTEEEKKLRPATILTPKNQNQTILQTLENQKSTDPIFLLKKTKDIKLQREFIIINLSKSKNENRIEYSCLNQLSKKFQHLIICIVGNLEKSFPYSDLIKIKKITNILEISTIDKQTIINYIWSCKKFYSFDCQFVKYCVKNKILIYIFDSKKNATNFLKDSAYHL